MNKIFNKITEISKAFNKEDFPGRNLHLSFVVYKGRIISIGQNSKKTHPINLRNKKITNWGLDISGLKGTCSELSAVSYLKNISHVPFSKCALINIRINKLNEFNLAKPCVSCINLLRFFSFKRIFYTDEAGRFVEFAV